MRGNPIRPRADLNFSKLGYRLIPADEFFEIGIEKTIEIIRERVGDMPLYITFDLDVLDPADAPAVSNLEPLHEGLRASQIVKIFHGLRGMNIIGGDIVCMIPTKDNPNNITAMNAMAIMFEMVALIADRMEQAKKG